MHFSLRDQEGEISFCAYNTGIGWRQLVEKMHMTATLTKWYDERGRHEIFAGDKRVSIGKPEHTLALKDELVTTDVQHDLDQLGVAKNAREEKMRARDAEMAKLYRKHVLQEPEGAELITLSAITPALKPRADRPERDETEVDSFGD